MEPAKLDVHGHVARYFKWKSGVMNGDRDLRLTKANFNILCNYIFDMETGANVSRGNKRGGRSYIRLNSLRQRISQIMRMLQKRGVQDITQVTRSDITSFFSDLRSGVIVRQDGLPYKSISTYASNFCAFWHWHMRVLRRSGKPIDDVTEDVDRTDQEKSRFVYLSKTQLDKMLPYFDRDEQLILLFCFDSMIRSPTELLSLRARDVYRQEGEVWLNIPSEIAKHNRSRTFNLVYCGEEIMNHIQRKLLEPEDRLFVFTPGLMNKRLQEVAVQVFGDVVSDPRSGEQWGKITLYDFRHSGAIHFRVLAKDNPAAISLDAVRERGGWADFKQLNNYTRFLGIDGRIERKGLFIKEESSDLRNEVEQLREENQKMREQFTTEIQSEMEKLRRQFENDAAERAFARKYVTGDIPKNSV